MLDGRAAEGLGQQKLHEAQGEEQSSAPGAEQSQASAQTRDQLAWEHTVYKFTSSSYPFYILYVPQLYRLCSSTT